MAFEIQTLPDNWKIVKVEHCGEVITGTTPKTERADYYGGDVPFISPMDINGHRFIRKTRTTLTDNGAKEARILPPGSVLVTCIGILGKVGQIDCEATTNQQINSIIPAVRVIMPSYCFWAAHLLKRQLDILAGLQVVPIVNKRVFSNLLMPVPPLPEQRRIAEILDTIDEAIQKTEALISKLKAMKQGLLHDLLTRGLDKNGKPLDLKAHLITFSDVVQVNPKTDMYGLNGSTNVSFIPMSDVSESGQWLVRQTRSLRDVRNGYTCFKENDVLFAKITPCMENGKGGHAIGLVNGIGFGTTEFHVLT